MNKKRILITAAIGALTVGTAGGLSLALPSTAGSSTTAPLTAPPAAAPNAAQAVLPAAVTKLPTMAFLPLSLAQKAATTALNSCMRQGFPVTVTVVNADGITIVVLRNDGASGVSVTSSAGKALASAGFRTPSDQLGANAASNPGLLTVPGFVLLGGGLPISSGGKVVAGIGVGGAPSGTIDKTCAQAGLNAIAGSM